MKCIVWTLIRLCMPMYADACDDMGWNARECNSKMIFSDEIFVKSITKNWLNLRKPIDVIISLWEFVVGEWTQRNTREFHYEPQFGFVFSNICLHFKTIKSLSCSLQWIVVVSVGSNNSFEPNPRFDFFQLIWFAKQNIGRDFFNHLCLCTHQAVLNNSAIEIDWEIYITLYKKSTV